MTDDVIIKMQRQWHGLLDHRTSSRHGLKLDVVKSGLQKYIRRGHEQLALCMAFEMYDFINEPLPGATAVLTNLYNRLAIIAVEDIGPANTNLVLKVLSYVLEKNRDPIILYNMVVALCRSQKTRLVDHLIYIYTTSVGQRIANINGIPIDTKFTPDIVEFTTKYQESNIFHPSDTEQIKSLISAFRLQIQNKDYNAMTWASYYLTLMTDHDTMKIDKISKRSKPTMTSSKTTDSSVLLWLAMQDLLDPLVCDILCRCYYSISESMLFLVMAICMIVYEQTYTATAIPTSGAASMGSNIESLLNGEYVPTVEDYILDKHTYEGKVMGRDILHFVTVGSQINNVSPMFDIEIFKQVYEQTLLWSAAEQFQV